MGRIHTVESNGIKYSFRVIADLTQPCPQCGVPACGKENYLWYAQEGERYAFIFDGGLFDLMGEEYFSKNITKVNYAQLPQFMKEWNEHRGWEDCWDFNGYELGIEDFIQSLNLIKIEEFSQWLREDTLQYIQEMKAVAYRASRQKQKLYITRG